MVNDKPDYFPIEIKRILLLKYRIWPNFLKKKNMAMNLLVIRDGSFMTVETLIGQVVILAT